MLVHPARWRGSAIGLAVVLLSLSCAALLAGRIAQEPVGFESFVAGVLVGLLALLGLLFAYWTYSCWSLSYGLDRNSVSVRWGGNLLQIPLASIQALIPGDSAAEPQLRSGIRWPGYWIGRGTVPGFVELDEVHLFSTHTSYQQLLYVLTPLRVYGISVPDAAEFAREIGLRRRMGPTESVQEGVRRASFWEAPVWRDPGVMVPMLLALAANLGLFGFLTWSFVTAPDTVAQHLTPLGVVDQTGPKEGLLVLPKLGLLSLLVNSMLGFILHDRERFASYLVAGMSLVVQVILWGGTIYLLSN